MIKIDLTFGFLFLLLLGCQNSKTEPKSITNLIVTNNTDTIVDPVFVVTLDKYIEQADEWSKSKFVQVFINYEQNISRYIYFKTKSLYDLTTEQPDDYFYYRDHVVLVYTGMSHLLNHKNNLPKDLNSFLEPKELFNDIDSTGNFRPDFNSGNVAFGSANWELRVYHSFKDSLVLNKYYDGHFIWDGSRVNMDTSAKFVPPVIHEDVIEE